MKCHYSIIPSFHHSWLRYAEWLAGNSLLSTICRISDTFNYRQEHPLHGYKQIEDYLKNRYFIVVPQKKIRELLKHHGLIGDSDSSFDQSSHSKEGKGTRRFEASYPRKLFQIDITYVYLINKTICYLIVVLNDYSRFCVSCQL